MGKNQEQQPSSIAPDGTHYSIPQNYTEENKRLDQFTNQTRPTVVIQGLGFVGCAMVAALTQTKDSSGAPAFQVIGIDLPTPQSYWKIEHIKRGISPITSSDHTLDEAISQGAKDDNLTATASDHAFSLASTVVVDVNLDITKNNPDNPQDHHFSYDTLKAAINTAAQKIQPDTLILLETTIPPGTTEHVIRPYIEDIFEQRGLPRDAFYLAHSYERVMPGANYLSSITDFYRAFAGINPRSTSKAREFLSTFINTKDYPLQELHNTTASETAKVLENSYRAANIAFIQEWTEFAHQARINLFQVIEAIRIRPTHKNIRQPGLGVGGYCLTKDALLADWGSRHNFQSQQHLTQSLEAVRINDAMPRFTCQLIEQHLPNTDHKHIAMLGISYLNDVGDTRFSPSETIYDYCQTIATTLHLHDPYLTYWPEKQTHVCTDWDDAPEIKQANIILLLVAHTQYCQLSADDWISLFPNAQLIVDANNLLTDETAKQLSQHGITLTGTGKGHWQDCFNQET